LLSFWDISHKTDDGNHLISGRWSASNKQLTSSVVLCGFTQKCHKLGDPVSTELNKPLRGEVSQQCILLHYFSGCSRLVVTETKRLWVRLTRSTASHLEQVANILCAQTNSASYPQWDGKWVLATATHEGLVLLIGAMVCLLAAPWVQLSVSAGNGWPHNALRHH